MIKALKASVSSKNDKYVSIETSNNLFDPVLFKLKSEGEQSGFLLKVKEK